MGLDMYLHAERYVSSHDTFDKKDPEIYRTIVLIAGAEDFASPSDEPFSFSHVELKVLVAYWRKANQIHQWFVDNVQGGEDDCQPYYVSREQLTELRDICKQLLERVQTEPVKAQVNVLKDRKLEVEEQEQRRILNPEIFEERLPSRGGFFFGSTDYDEYYLQDLEATVAQLERALLAPSERWSFYYRSSW